MNNSHSVFGTKIYSSLSDICSAATHSGILVKKNSPFLIKLVDPIN